MKVLFFARCREAAGCESGALAFDQPVLEVEFWSALTKAFPGLAAFRKTARLARNEAYLDNDALLYPDDEIAILPPVSGG